MKRLVVILIVATIIHCSVVAVSQSSLDGQAIDEMTKLDCQLIWNSMYCRKFNGAVCVECSNGSYMKNGRCLAIDPNCEQFNTVNEQCLQCYTGYKLSLAGKCQIDNSPVTDLLCKRFDGAVCVECSNGSYMKNGRCISIDQICSFIYHQLLFYSACYQGFYNNKLQKCVQIPRFEIKSGTIHGCRVLKDGICLECIESMILNKVSGQCECKCQKK